MSRVATASGKKNIKQEKCERLFVFAVKRKPSVWWSMRTNLIQITRVVLVSGHKGAGSLCEDVVKRDKLRRFISKNIHKIEMRDFQPLALAIFKAKECFVSSL